MASFEDKVLAFTRVFLRLDKTGTDSDADSWPDSAVSNHDGIQIYTGATEPARGHTSPVETDGSSRAFEAWVNAGIESLAGESRIRVPNDSDFDAPGDFTLIQFLRPLAKFLSPVTSPWSRNRGVSERSSPSPEEPDWGATARTLTGIPSSSETRRSS